MPQRTLACSLSARRLKAGPHCSALPACVADPEAEHDVHTADTIATTNRFEANADIQASQLNITDEEHDWDPR